MGQCTLSHAYVAAGSNARGKVPQTKLRGPERGLEIKCHVRIHSSEIASDCH